MPEAGAELGHAGPLSEAADGSPADGNRWVAVEVSAGRAVLEGPASSGLAVGLRSGRRIEVGRGFDAQSLAQLVDVLERL